MDAYGYRCNGNTERYVGSACRAGCACRVCRSGGVGCARRSGRVERCSDAQSDAYWALRPRGSQLGAWASAQSTIVAGRTVLDQALAGVTRRFDGVEEIPRPPHWGGWRIVPWQVEFWQGRADRMHDRLRFEVGRDDSWSVRRLAP